MAFAELIAKTNFSFLEGASHPEEMVQTAASLGYHALGIADHHGFYGVPRAHVAAKTAQLPLVVGTEVRLGNQRAVLLAKNRNGYGNLCELATHFHSQSPPGLDWKTFFDFTADCFCLIPAWELEAYPLSELKRRFPDSLFLFTSQFLEGQDFAHLFQAEHYSALHQLPVIVTNEPLFHSHLRKPLQDVLTCIRHTCQLKNAGFKLLPNAERTLKSITTLESLFPSHPDWLENTCHIADACRFSLDELRYHYPNEWIPQGETADSYLARLVWSGAKIRYAEVTGAVRYQIERELSLIQELQYADYFLTIWDTVQFAKKKQILYQGRGSAANSIVCYLLEITAIDPIRLELLFERFISRERQEPPDIDIDFEHERREEVIQYLYERYGRDRAAITAEVICYRRKSSLREVAKVFDIPLDKIEKFQVFTHRRNFSEVPLEEFKALAPEMNPETLKQYFFLANEIYGFPRHLGTHVGGFVLCHDKLNRNVPIQKAAMPGRTIVQWDKNDLDALGFVRVDVLGLGILTCLRKCFDLVEQTYDRKLTLSTVPAEDAEVYDALCQADTVGVFQIESRAQMNMLPRLKPRNFYDLVIEISLVRPGPIQGEMVHPYLKRRAGKEPIEYAHPELESILKKTCGVPLFQEQIMKMAMVVAGFSAGEADQLRRAMGTWRKRGNLLSEMGNRFCEGLVKKGIAVEFAQRIFSQIEGFAEYGFPESHAASFAILAYVSAYLKHYYPDAYLCAILNAQPMGFYASHSLIQDANRHGVVSLPIDVQYSDWDNTMENAGHVRLGFREIFGLRKQTSLAIEKARQEKSFSDFLDFTYRLRETLSPTVLTKRDLFFLASADGFRSLGLERRQALWEIQALPIQDSHFLWHSEKGATLPKESEWEKISTDYSAQGSSLYAHPMAHFRPQFAQEGVLSSKEIRRLITLNPKRRNKRWAKAAGIVICRQMPPSASGVLFVTLEDEFGFVNLVIWKKVFEQFRECLLTQSFLLCEGNLEVTEGTTVTHLIVDQVSPLFPPERVAFPTYSHDFH